MDKMKRDAIILCSLVHMGKQDFDLKDPLNIEEYGVLNGHINMLTLIDDLSEVINELRNEFFDDNKAFTFTIRGTGRRYHAKKTEDGKHYTISWKKVDGFLEDGESDPSDYTVKEVESYLAEGTWVKE